ncbi:MAG: VOC family protein [Pseudomonadota bacterium]
MTHAAAASDRRGFSPRALGEIAVRCADVARQTAFYRDVIGLNVFAERPRPPLGTIVFFDLGPSFGGHRQVLALFPQDAELPPHDGARHRAGPLHHIALAVTLDDQTQIKAWFARIGQAFHVVDFDWVGWRGIFTHDPEGNMVELVAARPNP